MESEIKKYSKVHLRRNLRSIFPQRKKHLGAADVYKYSLIVMFEGNSDLLQFISFFNFSMKCFFEGNGKLIASDRYVQYVITYFWRQDEKFRDQIKKIYKCIIMFFPEKVEKKITYFIKESYISGQLYLLIDFAKCINTILPHRKITDKNFLDYLLKTKFGECKNGLIEPIDSYKYTNFYLKYFGN